MDYEARSVRKYKQYYDELYDAAYKEAHVGRTTEYEANLVAQDRAHYVTQQIMAQTDLYWLASEVFGMREAMSRQSGIKGRRIWYPPIHGELCDELQGSWDSLIMLSRNMLKTTVAKIWVVQQIIRDPANVRIGMWSKSAAKVQSELSSIRGMLQNKRLLKLFPDRLIANPKKWSVNNKDAITVTRHVEGEGDDDRYIPVDEAQIEVHGLDSTVTGRHYTHHYYDDIIDRDNTSSATQLEKAREQWASIQGLKSVDTIEKIVGTRYHQLDLYSTIEAENLFPEEHRLIRPGVTIDGNILYPFFTKQWLEQQKRRMGEYLYGCQYPLDTRPKSHRMFALPVPHYSDLPSDPKYYVAIDPSTGKSDRHDKTGVAVGCVSRSNPTHVYYVEADSYTWKPEKIAEEVVNRVIKYQPEKVGIEYGLQQALEPLIRIKLQERQAEVGRVRNPIWVDIKTGGGRGALNKADKIDRTLGAMVRDQRAYFREDMTHLFQQMSTFNPNVQKNEDDILDACSMLIQTIEHFAQAHWANVEEKTAVGGIPYDWFYRRKRSKGGLRDRIYAA